MKTGLEILRGASAGEIAAIVANGHPPFERGEVQCDLVSCEACWKAWLETGEPPVVAPGTVRQKCSCKPKKDGR